MVNSGGCCNLARLLAFKREREREREGENTIWLQGFRRIFLKFSQLEFVVDDDDVRAMMTLSLCYFLSKDPKYII